MFAENLAFSGLFVSNRSGLSVALRGTLLKLEALSSYKFYIYLARFPPQASGRYLHTVFAAHIIVVNVARDQIASQ
jgi:hypothetical protein